MHIVYFLTQRRDLFLGAPCSSIYQYRRRRFHGGDVDGVPDAWCLETVQQTALGKASAGPSGTSSVRMNCGQCVNGSRPKTAKPARTPTEPERGCDRTKRQRQ